MYACVKEREKKQIKANWQFAITDARKKLNKHYKKVNSENEKFAEKTKWKI